MYVALKSDVGKKRKNNEDRIDVDLTKGIFVLADGMGGQQAGEIASMIAVKEAMDYLKNKLSDQANLEEKDSSKALVESLFKAHDAVREKAKSDFSLIGMGTTLVAMMIKDDKAFICHIGDSRAYLLQKEIKRITKDQTVGDYLVEHNIVSREQVSPQKWHTLTQAVGVSDNLAPDLNQVDLKSGDYLLLCSDGLSDMLTDDEIFGIVRKYNNNLEKAVDGLIKEANKKGGKDNISVVLVRV